MDNWRVSDSFANIKVEIRFIQFELENRADVLLTIYNTISNYEVYLICFVYFIGTIVL